jgi:hypothetical protein
VVLIQLEVAPVGLSIKTIERVVADLLSSGDFETAFSACRET